MNGVGSVGVTEVAGAKLECQSKRAWGKRTNAYLVLQACYYNEVRIDAPHMVDSDGVLYSRLGALRATSGIPQPHCSLSAAC